VKQAHLARAAAAFALVAVAVLAGAGPAGAASVTYAYDPTSAVARADAPLRIVLVGFKKGQVDESALVSMIPQTQRPGVLIPYDEDAGDFSNQCGVFFGANTLLDHGRCYYEDGAKPYLMPLEYSWKPRIIYAPTKFTTALFQQMIASTTTGDFHGTTYRPYLEAYNSSRGMYRGAANQVAAGAPVRFFDAERMETWLAQNSRTYFGVDLGPKGGPNLGPSHDPGYTIFVLNSGTRRKRRRS